MSSEQTTRRDLLRGAVILGTGAALGAAPGVEPIVQAAAAATPVDRRPFRAYSRNSFFRSSVRRAPVDRVATRNFRDFMRSHPDQRGIRYPLIKGVNGNKWGMPYAMGVGRHPVWRLTGPVPDVVAKLESRGFHAPRWLGQILTGTNDSPFVVIDRANGFTVWGANARQVGPRTIRVSDAGLFKHRSNGLDRRNRRSNSNRNYRSRGAIPDAMVIRSDLMRHAIRNRTGLGHVLHLFLCETRTSSGHCHPMVATEQGRRGWGAEGVRIALSPRVDVERRGLNGAGRVIARTLQNHGAYIGDNAGRASTLKAEQASRSRDPWRNIGLGEHVLKGISWDDFVVLPRGWQ